MYLTRKHVSRRLALRGMGAALGLPLLDAMLPAQTSAPVVKPRLACIEMVHGAAGSTLDGSNKHYWSPSKTGRDFEFTQTLEPLAAFRDYLTIISHTDLNPATAFDAPEEGADHFRSSAVYLSAAHPKQTEGSDIRAGITIDQIYANAFGQDTPLPSIQLCIENVDATGACAYGYACVYADTISWSSPSQPLPMTLDPRAAFERLFGDGAEPSERMRRRKLERSILDGVMTDIARLKKQLSPSDGSRLSDYLEDVREVERRIQRIERFNASGEKREIPAAPVGVPDSYEEHVKLMFDLQVLAFSTEITRVSAFKMSRDVSQRVFPESGVKVPFHSASHHNESPARIADFAKINRYHVGLLPYFFNKLKNTPDGDGNLLDHSLVLYGSPMGDSHVHNHKRVPMLLLGKANGRVRGGQHILAPDGTPMANALLTILDKLGVEQKSIGDSTGVFDV